LIPLITASEIGTRIAEVVRNIVSQLFEVATPVLTAIGIGQILIGLLLAAGFRQEFLGYRLVIGGIITLIFTYIVAPLLLQFL
jgi:multisubunit Na+/H+ antiporter MnhG subunit